MAKYKEIIHMINDELKGSSDDAYFTLDHILFLCNKYRAYIIKTHSITKKILQTIMPTSPLYQTICVNLEKYEPTDVCSDTYLRSIDKIPNIMEEVTPPLIFPVDPISANDRISYTSINRLKYVGYNKWMGTIIYAAIDPDGYLLLKSNNPQFIHLSQVKFKGIFEDTDNAAKLSCNKDDEANCDLMENDYSIEEYMIPELIQSVVKELLGAEYRPTDSANNAQDDKAQMATFLRNNIKSPLQKQIEGD